MVKPTTQENLTVPFSSIEIDLEFNSRTVYDDIPELAKSIEAHGLITPLTVTKNGGDKLKLVAGYRRYQALEKLGWGDKPIKVSIESYATDGELYIANLVENTARKDMHNADLAKRFAELESGTYRRIINPAAEGEEETVGEKLSRKEIARHTGLSVAHIGNLIRSYQNLGPSVLKVWNKFDIPLTQVIKWAAIPDEEKQLEKFGEWKEQQDLEKAEGKPKRKARVAKDEEESEESDEGTTSAPQAQGPSKSEMRSQKEALEEKVKSEKLKGEDLVTAKAKLKTLRWVLGEINRL